MSLIASKNRVIENDEPRRALFSRMKAFDNVLEFLTINCLDVRKSFYVVKHVVIRNFLVFFYNLIYLKRIIRFHDMVTCLGIEFIFILICR